MEKGRFLRCRVPDQLLESPLGRAGVGPWSLHFRTASGFSQTGEVSVQKCPSGPNWLLFTPFLWTKVESRFGRELEEKSKAQSQFQRCWGTLRPQSPFLLTYFSKVSTGSLLLNGKVRGSPIPGKARELGRWEETPHCLSSWGSGPHGSESAPPLVVPPLLQQVQSLLLGAPFTLPKTPGGPEMLAQYVFFKRCHRHKHSDGSQVGGTGLMSRRSMDGSPRPAQLCRYKAGGQGRFLSYRILST